MKRVFVCSPLRAETPEGRAANMELASELALAVLRAGHAPFVPHLWYAKLLNDEVLVERALGMRAGIAWLRTADEMWVYADSEPACSEGMRAEIKLAANFPMPIRTYWMPEPFAEVAARRGYQR